MTKKKLLLVEFMTVDRFHRGIPFPFIKGWGKERGLDVVWIRFGLFASIQFEQGERGIGLGEEDQDSLVRFIKKEKPTHVIFDRMPSQKLIALVRKGFPCVKTGFMKEGTGEKVFSPREQDAAPASISAVSGRSLDEWLDIPRQKATHSEQGNLFEAYSPDFGWIAANELARTSQSLPFVICGKQCSYNRPLRSNPFYSGVDLGASGISTGCAFCMRPRQEQKWKTPPLELARRQLRAIRETHPPFPMRPAIRICGEVPFFIIDQFARMLIELEFPPADFLFDARADRLLRHKKQLLRALHAIKGTGHRIHICLVGIENFSAGELLRMNKGLDPATNLAAIELLLSLERDHPDTFSIREHGGLSLILFTPWTSTKDLLINMAIVRQLNLVRLCGKFFTARLRLYPELPLARLAQRDNLIVDRYRDPLLDTAQRNFYPEEIPWRFQHPEIEPVNRIFTRLEKDAALAHDPLYTRIQAWLDSIPRANDTLIQAAHAAVTVAARHRRMPHMGRLLSEERNIVRPKEREVFQSAFPGNKIVLREIANPYLTWERIEQEEGLKPVRKIECVDLKHVAICRNNPNIFKNMQAYEAQRRESFSGFNVFFGDDRKAVAEAFSLTSMHERGEVKGEDEKARVMARIGVLLGYPECCSRAYADAQKQNTGSDEWVWLSRRIENPGRIPMEMHPFVLEYVPCSVLCAKSIARMGQVLKIMRRKDGKHSFDKLVSALRAPVVIFLDTAAGADPVRLAAETKPSERFRYRAVEVLHRDVRLRRVSQGDEMILEEGCITILRQGKEHAYFPMNAFIWWWEEAFHADFWRACIAVKTLAQRRKTQMPTPQEQPAVRKEIPSRESLRLKDDLSALLCRDEAASQRFAGFTRGPIQASEQPCVSFALENGEERIVLFIERRENARRPYLTAGDYAIYFENDTPLDSPKKRIAAREFARYLAGLLVGCA